MYHCLHVNENSQLFITLRTEYSNQCLLLYEEEFSNPLLFPTTSVCILSHLNPGEAQQGQHQGLAAVNRNN